MTGKEDFQRLIDLLRQHNVDLLHSREQRSKLAKPQHQKVSQLLKPQKQVISPSSNFRNVREISKVLYEGLSATNICSCHVVNLQLDGHSQRSGGTDGQGKLVQSSCFENSFRFLITKSLQPSEIHQGQCKVECTQLTVRSELQLAQACKLPKDSEDQKASISKGKSGVRFAIDEPDTKLHQKREPPDNPAFIFQHEMRAINSLCSLLAQPNPLCQRPMECLGIIKSVEAFMSAATYRHLVYSGSNATPTSFQTSLEDILPKRQLFPHEERLRLAMTLSYALLNFGSYETSWFRDHWRSKDVKFFLTQTTADPDVTLSPYITPSFLSQKAIVQHSNGKAAMAVGLARNEKLFSFALILTEIGLGGKLFDIDDPTGSVRGPTDDPFVEYLKAKNIVESRILGREMGLAYAKIVKQCFFCDFGVIGEADFSEEKLQAAFYDHVVCELERCLQKFRGVM